MVAPVGDPRCQHGRRGALGPLHVGACAENRIGVDDGGRFHPGDVFTKGRDVADLVGSAGVTALDADPIGELRILLDQLLSARRHALHVVVIRISRLNELVGHGFDAGNLQRFVAVEVQQ